MIYAGETMEFDGKIEEIVSNRDRSPILDQGIEIAEKIECAELKRELLRSIAISYMAHIKLIGYVQFTDQPNGPR